MSGENESYLTKMSDTMGTDLSMNEMFNPLEPFSFYLTMEEWMSLKPKEHEHYSDGRRGLQPGWTDLFESKLREVNPACMRWYTGSAKKFSSRKQSAPYFTGRAACKNPDCTLAYRLIIDKEPTANTKEVEVIVSPTGFFVPTDPLEVQNRTFSKMRKRESMKVYDDTSNSAPSQDIVVTDFATTVPKRYPPFVRYGKRQVGGSTNVMVGCGSGKTMEDLLYCSTLEADKAKLLAEKEKLEAETVMLRAKTEESIAKKVKLETETNNLIMQRLKLKHELNTIGLDVEIINVTDDNQLRQVLMQDAEDR